MHLIPWFYISLLILALSVYGQIQLSSLADAKGDATETLALLAVKESSTTSDCKDPFAKVKRLAFSPQRWRTNFCKHSVPYEEIQSGGPPRDGIPPLDEPTFVSVSEADTWLEDREPVIVFGLGEDVRAYPLQILTWHEIVNDVVNGTPVAVTFCPLCNTALVFERPTINGEVLTFGTSGNLRYSDLVMWDRQTESWWQQFSGEAIVGDLTGTQLKPLPTAIIAWSDFKARYPKRLVLSRQTGFERPYGTNPYVGYDDVDQSPFLYRGSLDDRLPPMARVLGVILDSQAGAYTYDRLRQEVVINDTQANTPIVVFWKGGTSSALDRPEIAKGRDVGTTGVFLRTVNGRVLTFTASKDGTFSDQETGSTWNILGQALDGPLAGNSLTPVVHYDTFWFVWAAFIPNNAPQEVSSK